MLAIALWGCAQFYANPHFAVRNRERGLIKCSLAAVPADPSSLPVLERRYSFSKYVIRPSGPFFQVYST
jgi:hypothetical protein